MGETPPASRAGTVQIAGRRLGAAPSVIAWVLGAMGLALVAACVALTCLTLDPQAFRDGAAVVFAVACGLLGTLVARRQPWNPEGVQRAVDRRFNRARYDAETTVAEFAGSLSGAVDLDTMRHSLAGVVQQALEPARVSVWISPGD